MRIHAGRSLALFLLSACSSDPTSEHPTLAEMSAFFVQAGQAGPTPFIALLQVHAMGLDAGGRIGVTVSPRPGSTSPPVSASYTYAALARRGHATSTEALT